MNRDLCTAAYSSGCARSLPHFCVLKASVVLASAALTEWTQHPLLTLMAWGILLGLRHVEGPLGSSVTTAHFFLFLLTFPCHTAFFSITFPQSVLHLPSLSLWYLYEVHHLCCFSFCVLIPEIFFPFMASTVIPGQVQTCSIYPAVYCFLPWQLCISNCVRDCRYTGWCQKACLNSPASWFCFSYICEWNSCIFHVVRAQNLGSFWCFPLSSLMPAPNDLPSSVDSYPPAHSH